VGIEASRTTIPLEGQAVAQGDRSRRCSSLQEVDGLSAAFLVVMGVSRLGGRDNVIAAGFLYSREHGTRRTTWAGSLRLASA
jgi:hypothetical protein